MRKHLSLLVILFILLAALRWGGSAAGFLVAGLAPALLLGRWLLCSGPVRWRTELTVRLGWFLAGVIAAALRPGLVPAWEILRCGLVVSLAAVFVETPLWLGPRLKWRWRVGFSLALAGMAVAAGPYLAAVHPLHTFAKRTPAVLGLAFEEVRFRTADGVRLEGWLVPHRRARGNLIFCHGHGRNRGHVMALLPTLHDLGLNVLALDFRGHGGSGGHTCTFGQREVLDVLAAADCLRQRCPDQPLFLAGVSLGAAVCLQALPRLPEVKAVWCEACFARLAPVVEHSFAWLPPWLRAPLTAGYCHVGWFDAGFWPPDVNPVEGLRGARVAVCFCHGRCDRLVPFDQAEQLDAAAAGPRCRWWVEGGSHYDLRRHRDAFLGKLRQFFQDRLASPGAML
jgi:pimeloyl-ACP methyl ester carboxylesterase